MIIVKAILWSYMVFSFLAILGGLLMIAVGMIYLIGGSESAGVVLILVGIGGICHFRIYRRFAREGLRL